MMTEKGGIRRSHHRTGCCGRARLVSVGIASSVCMPVLWQCHFPILVKLLITLNCDILHRLIGAIFSSGPSDHLRTVLGDLYAGNCTPVGDGSDPSTPQQKFWNIALIDTKTAKRIHQENWMEGIMPLVEWRQQSADLKSLKEHGVLATRLATAAKVSTAWPPCMPLCVVPRSVPA